VASGRRLGVMGGTFDPVHHGHLVTADRYLMTVIATASNPRFSVSRIEVDRDGPTYTVETLGELRRQSGTDVELFFITGADAMLEILHWKDPEEVLAKAHFIAATRPGYDIARFEKEAPTSHPRVSVMDIPALAISSSDIRRRVHDGEPIRYLVPEGVNTYIRKFNLYRQDA
jgi:nicotinate-nucleotide adenylyltransferase